jgi:nitrate/nitrite transporter NarK
VERRVPSRGGSPPLRRPPAPARRGFATGVFGVGMGGTALSAFFTPRFVSWFGCPRARRHRRRAGLTALLLMISGVSRRSFDDRSRAINNQHRESKPATSVLCRRLHST